MDIVLFKPLSNECDSPRKKQKPAWIFPPEFINIQIGDANENENDSDDESRTETSLAGVVDQIWKHYCLVRLFGGTLLQRNSKYDDECVCNGKRETKSIPFSSSTFSSIASAWALLIRLSLAFLSGSLFIIYHAWFAEMFAAGTLDDWITVAMQVIYFLVDLWTVVYIWWSSKQILKFQNNWDRYENLYERTFKSYGHREDSKVHFLGLSPQPANGFNIGPKMQLAYVLSFLSVLATCATFFLGTESPMFTLHYFVYTVLVSACVGADEVHALLVSASLSESYRHVAKGISGDLKYLKSKTTPKNLELLHVTGWKEMIKFIRKQIEVASRFHSPMMFVKIAMLMFCSTIALDTLFSAVQGKVDVAVIRNALLILGNSILRVLLRLYFVNMISSEEKKVLDTLTEIHTGSLVMDLNTRLELKDLTDMMRNDPSRIVFFGIIVIDIKLLLTISNVVVTYLIVLLQLRASQGH